MGGNIRCVSDFRGSTVTLNIIMGVMWSQACNARPIEDDIQYDSTTSSVTLPLYNNSASFTSASNNKKTPNMICLFFSKPFICFH